VEGDTVKAALSRQRHWWPSMLPAPPPAMPKVRSNVGIPPEILVRELRLYRNFLDGDWRNPSDGPIRYPKGNRNGA
jgi:hypothetical protein